MSQPTTFLVTHLEDDQTFHRTPMLINPRYEPIPSTISVDPAVETFHRLLPDYAETPLTPLPDLARELNISAVYVKDESLRFGLPSFKMLGASWAVYRAVCETTGLPPIVSLKEAGAAAKKFGIKLVTCSAGNWGRAVARMGKYLGTEVVVFLFKGVSDRTRDIIREEGATVIMVDGSYDDAIIAAMERSKEEGTLLVMDTSWEAFEKIPQWVVDGYSTMLTETERQVKEHCGRGPDMCIVPVGVGSIAQAVTAHFLSRDTRIRNVTVEPEAAPCLMESLHTGKITPIKTEGTVMPGMNCGTVSKLAWLVLSTGVYASIVVSDVESHEGVNYLSEHGVNAGPCGAATLAAARKAHRAGLIGNDPHMVLILFSTEGTREYVVPST